MAELKWEVKADVTSADRSLKAVEDRYDKVGRAAKGAGDKSADAGERGARGLKKVGDSGKEAQGGVKGLVAEVQGLATKFPVAAALGTAAFAAIAMSIREANAEAAKHLAQLQGIQDFSRGQVGASGAPIMAQVESVVGDLSQSPGFAIQRDESARLAAVLADANEEVTVADLEAALMAASKTVGALAGPQREEFVRNLGIVQKQELGLSAEDEADLALRATQERVDLKGYDAQLLTAREMGLTDQQRQEMMALAVGLGKQGQESGVLRAMLSEAENLSRTTQETTGGGFDMVGGVPVIRPEATTEKPGQFGSASDAFGAIMADPTLLQGRQAIGLRSGLGAAAPIDELVAGDVLGGLGMSRLGGLERDKAQAEVRIEAGKADAAESGLQASLFRSQSESGLRDANFGALSGPMAAAATMAGQARDVIDPGREDRIAAVMRENSEAMKQLTRTMAERNAARENRVFVSGGE